MKSNKTNRVSVFDSRRFEACGDQLGMLILQVADDEFQCLSAGVLIVLTHRRRARLTGNA